MLSVYRKRGIRRILDNMKTLTIVIPVFNEGERIENSLETLKKGFSLHGLKLTNLIFVNDGSQDKTLKLIKEQKSALEKKLKTKVKILSYFPNRGRGYAIRESVLISNSDYVLYLDADLSIPLSNLSKCISQVRQGVDLIFGSKKKPQAKALIPRSILRNIVGYGHSVVASLILGVFAFDFQGGFKMFSKKLIREVFPFLTIDRWGFDMEIIFLAKKLGFRTYEFPVVWSHKENGSKVKLLRDIIRSLKDMFRIKLNWYYQTLLLPLLQKFNLSSTQLK